MVFTTNTFDFNKDTKIPTDLGFAPKGKRPGRLVNRILEERSMDIKSYSDLELSSVISDIHYAQTT